MPSPFPYAVVPAPEQHQTTSQWLVRWEQQYKEEQSAQFKIENVRFAHDPHWRDGWLSIQNAHDCKAPIWKAGRAMMLAAAFGPVTIFTFL